MIKEIKKGFLPFSSFRNVSVRDISCYAIPRTTTLRGDGVGVHAFTLIELLVVVLIIGILAAIALPKYEVAVEKSRLAEAMSMSKSLQQAIDVWVLENGLPFESNTTDTSVSFLGEETNGNGNLTIDLSNLDCSNDTACSSKNFSYGAWCSFGGCGIIALRIINGDKNNITYGVQWDKNGSGNWQGADCSYSSDDAIGEKICKGLVAQNNGFFLCPDC